MGGKKFGVDQDEILIINVIKRIGWFWGGRAKRVHPKITNSFDNINNNNLFYLRPLPDVNIIDPEFESVFPHFLEDPYPDVDISTQEIFSRALLKEELKFEFQKQQRKRKVTNPNTKSASIPNTNQKKNLVKATPFPQKKDNLFLPSNLNSKVANSPRKKGNSQSKKQNRKIKIKQLIADNNRYKTKQKKTVRSIIQTKTQLLIEKARFDCREEELKELKKLVDLVQKKMKKAKKQTEIKNKKNTKPTIQNNEMNENQIESKIGNGDKKANGNGNIKETVKGTMDQTTTTTTTTTTKTIKKPNGKQDQAYSEQHYQSSNNGTHIADHKKTNQQHSKNQQKKNITTATTSSSHTPSPSSSSLSNKKTNSSKNKQSKKNLQMKILDNQNFSLLVNALQEHKGTIASEIH
ncbi:hypothetical protein M0813_24186 [Anaeramoeba flamelloides]|uniref:Uncharacterized protein n=1 Tax=Anaeramoeba flamelloides TaxID=1746091 RepID=A0ABQ8Y6N1_9EUKA|nr:hypothetical protein M0813_24186 [Anaeramoeba flamelloides]